MKPRQFISNGSFEKGETVEDALLWHRMTGTPALADENLGWAIDYEEAAHGSRSLKTTTGAPLLLMEEVWEPIPLEEPWVFSIYLKAGQAGVSCELSVTLWWKFEQETISSVVGLTTQWKRYEVIVHGIPRLDRRSSAIQGPVSFTVAPRVNATVWADAAQWNRQADASDEFLHGPDAFFEDAPKWILPHGNAPRPTPRRGDWAGSLPLRVWREGPGESSRQPVAAGVPFDKERWNGGGSVRLQKPGGDEIPVQTEILAHWEDGRGVQMLGVFFTDELPPGWSDYTLLVEKEPGEERLPEPFAWTIEHPAAPGVLWDCIEDRERRLFGAASLRGTDLAGTVYDSAWDAEATWSVEREGPLYRTVCCNGRLKSREGRSLLAYTARLHAWRDIPGLKLELSVVNTRKEGSVRLRSLEWHGRDAREDGANPSVAVMTGYLPKEDLFTTRRTGAGGTQTAAGKAPLCVRAGAILLHAPEAWQRHPCALAHERSEWRAFLWPATGVRALALPRGLALAGEFWLREASPGTGDLPAWEAEPIGVAAPSWWAENPVFSPLAAADPKHYPFIESRLGGAPSLGALAPARVEADRAYGAFDFGDNHGDGGWANLESFNDWCALLIGLRSGDAAALRAGLRGARHYRDVDMHQLTGACYEHTFNHVAGEADMSHAWPDGVGLHYLLTGSRRSLEMARLHGEYTLALGAGELAKGLRTLGRYLFNLAEGYRLTGDLRFRERFESQLAIARRLLAEDPENPDRSIFSYIGQWQVRRLVPFHAWYGIAALQNMEALTGDPALAGLIGDEIAATLNPELSHLDLRELWPGLPPEEGLPLMLADFGRHRGSFFFPVMMAEAARRNRPELARLALATLYAGAVEGRSAGFLQAVLSFAALRGVALPEETLVSAARELLWNAAAETLLNGDFGLSPDDWHYWRPWPSKSLSHHTNWQAVRRMVVALDPNVCKEGPRSLRFNLLAKYRQGLIKLDTARFRLEPGEYTLRGWLRWEEGAAPPLLALELRDLGGHFELLPFLPPENRSPSCAKTVRAGATLAGPDAGGWRRMEVSLHVHRRAVANLFIQASLRKGAARGHLWLDGFRLERGAPQAASTLETSARRAGSTLIASAS